MSLKDFKTRVKIKAEQEDVFAAFTNPFTIELWSGYPAVMPSEAGQEFSMWEGDIQGRLLELVPENKIVQEWYFGDQTEPSVATIKLFPSGSKVQVDVIHINIPAEAFEDIAQGWEEYILGAIKEFLEVE
ncbi:SRPBCC domain-containing protein [Alkalitalea saponilacus]|uniref:Activator of Hsp90 ATPase homolog 1-like protein n=1 Tax=Alkalitalea saponilacus TaxID=889453 RepID=A0A1T5HTR0_9BACT|nr:SRPBCC domain-containing protein [Alkalitalea saponilacus]ASB48497.1 ATPase [Alkalitalea saponilacus]SKC24085.1 Activator of Hsp90 ATPase homolog 1-like protein [Alkalitalea saponilacus]